MFCNIIITKTKFASDLILKNTNLHSMYIPDPIRYTKIEPKKNINSDLRLLWFGTSANHDSIPIALNSINKINVDVQIDIVTKIENDLIVSIRPIKLFDKIKLYNFSEKTLVSKANEADIIFIPYLTDQARLVKSSNRIIDSINFGRFVVMSDVSQFKEFSKYTFQ